MKKGKREGLLGMLFLAVMGDASPSKPKQLKIDEALFFRIGQGDQEAFAELYRLTESAVYSFVLSILRNPEDTKDIVQETFLKIRSAAHLYKPMGKPLAWVFTIARNLSMSFLRQSGRMTDYGSAIMEDDIRFSYVTDPTDRIVLEALLHLLEEQDRQILLLRLVSGLRHQEIAASLGIPLSTALSRYHRALKKLRAYCAKEGLLT